VFLKTQVGRRQVYVTKYKFIEKYDEKTHRYTRTPQRGIVAGGRGCSRILLEFVCPLGQVGADGARHHSDRVAGDLALLQEEALPED